jgi:hypothetical protein
MLKALKEKSLRSFKDLFESLDSIWQHQLILDPFNLSSPTAM